MKFTIEWLKAAAVRALRTAAQVALTMLTVGMTMNDVDWIQLVSVSAVAAVYSILTSIVTDLPEVGSDGTMAVDESGKVSGVDLQISGDDLIRKQLIKLNVTKKE